ncbi:MAG TPA: FecR family protein [Stellaceae bacterium]|nr:FecR family protein [Stellaceae bacterium]
MPRGICQRKLPAWLAATVLLVLPGAALAAPGGTVVGLFGSCFIEGGGSRSAAKIGQSVQVGDTVDVPTDGKLKLRLSDGSVVSVAAGTRMTLTTVGVDGAGQRQDVHLSLAQGLLRAVVAPVERPASFEVDTAVGTAAVRSTDWFVEGSATAMQVGVLSGSVEMTSAATKRRETIPARWGARLEAGRDPVPPRVWSRAEFDAVIARTDVK